MAEHLIRTWKKMNGTWDVTHHMGTERTRYLSDVNRDFKNFPSREKADEYAKSLFKRFTKRGNRVELKSPDIFGKEIKGGWTGFGKVKEIFIVSKDGVIKQRMLRSIV